MSLQKQLNHRHQAVRLHGGQLQHQKLLPLGGAQGEVVHLPFGEGNLAGVVKELGVLHLSPQARKLALTELTRNGFDIYGFLAELLRETRAQDAQEMFDAYLTRRDVEDEQVEPLMEIIRACMARREGRA